MEDATERTAMSKAMSGRWILTVVCAIVFLFCSVYKILSPVDTKEIIMMVVIFYFQKQATDKKEEQK
jgi:uncharacterized membrane protein HdeD (DUF308 family)